MIPELPPVVYVHINEIEVSDETFRISRPLTGDELLKSISSSGILALPLILEKDNRKTVVFGHNRLYAAATCGFNTVPVRLAAGINAELYLWYVAGKVYHDEIGPCGKCRVVSIMDNVYNLEPGKLRDVFSMLGIPAGFQKDRVQLDRVLGLPLPLREYLDVKNVNFRVIRTITGFPGYAVDFLGRMVEETLMRVNYFREIVAMMDDIMRRDGSLESVTSLEVDRSLNRKSREEELYREIRGIRYPVYMGMKEKADDLVKKLHGKGLNVDIPPYLEGDSISVSFTLRKGKGLADAPLAVEKEIEVLLDDLLSIL